jgi:diacylglycerol kinase (ATP)
MTRAALDALDEAAPGTDHARPELIEAASVAEVRERTAVLVGHGFERVVVIGGDGLLHHVVQGAAGRRLAVGVVPVGSGNDFAAALGLPTDPIEAARVAMGPTRPIDLLRSARGWAASVATVGFSAAVNERAERMRWPRGAARYSLATMLELPHLEPIELVIHLRGTTGPGRPLAGGAVEEHRVRAALVAVANTSMFGGGMRICPDAQPDDGLLDVTIIDAIGRIDLLRHFGRVFRGTHVRHPSVSVHRARSVTLVAPDLSEGAARADGELWGRLPLTIDAVPNALRVAAPMAAPVAPRGRFTRRRRPPG